MPWVVLVLSDNEGAEWSCERKVIGELIGILRVKHGDVVAALVGADYKSAVG